MTELWTWSMSQPNAMPSLLPDLGQEGIGWVTDRWGAQYVWVLLSPRTNPPNIRVIPRTLEYLRIYFHELVYMEPQMQAGIGRAFKRRVYYSLWTVSTAENNTREVRVMQLQSAIDLSLVWCSLHNVGLPDGGRSAWYIAIHDIIRTSMNLHRIRLMDTVLIEGGRTPCHIASQNVGVIQKIWEWTRTRRARLRWTDPRRIPTKWLLRPCFQLWPRQRHQAILWFLENIFYVVL